MMAALLAVGVSRCLSRQLTLRLSFPPMNHFANGAFHWSTFVHGLNQTSSCFAWRAQNFSGDRIDSLYITRYSAMDLIRAARANSFGGGKTRSSWRTDVMLTGLVLSIQMRGVSVRGPSEVSS